MKRLYFIILALLALLGTTAEAVIRPDAVEVPIIMYHKVTKDNSQLGKFAITPDELEADFQFIQESDYTPVTMEALINFVKNDGTLPDKPLVLTFDDGYFSDYRYLLPLVRRYQIPVVSSIIGKTTDAYTEEAREDIIYPHLIWPQVEEMALSGLIEIQNHGYDLHQSVRGTAGAKKRHGESRDAYAERLEADLMRLQTAVEKRLGTAPTTFTYPFGAKSEESDAILQTLGFEASLSVEGKRNLVIRGEPDCLFSMGRIIRPHGRTVEQILAS
ncbi:MAG: polysaccharide deacetylase family protein [Oscillospiraceae bacterium]|nr:polysaccharide deacetylase family protein [Oscillospiraceae bacterium]